MTDSDPAALDSPFAVWRALRGLPRWYFARRCPPPLVDDRRWVRGLRTTFLLGTVGLTSSWISTLWVALEQTLLWPLPWGDDGALVFAPGIVFGLVVLLPLSRWLGRGWILSGLLVPISTAVYYGSVMLYVQNAFESLWLPVEWFGAAAAGLWGGFGVSVWLIAPRKPRTWCLVPLVTVVGGMVTWGMSVTLDGPQPSMPFGLDWLMELLSLNLLLSPFQVLVAIALGVRLWWPPPNADPAQPSPRPAANTAETSTMNPGSSTDVAVSPDLNSP